MSPHVVMVPLLLLLLGALGGYSTGRRLGRKQGFIEGLAYSPLELRRLGWEQGQCPICNWCPCTNLQDGSDRVLHQAERGHDSCNLAGEQIPLDRTEEKTLPELSGPELPCCEL